MTTTAFQPSLFSTAVDNVPAKSKVEQKGLSEYYAHKIDLKLTKNPHPIEDFRITSSESVVKFLRTIYNPDTLGIFESAYAVFVNRDMKTIGWVCLSHGGVAGTVIDPKILFSAALLNGGSALFLSHSHPSGNLQPSTADIELTKRLIKAAQLLDMQVLDHIILTEKGYFSMSDNGIAGL